MAQPYVGEIRIFAGNFAPAGWQFCDGTILPISENETLFNLIGTTYGGDGQDTFAVPDLRGRLPIPGTGSDGPGGADGSEPFELLIFRGFSSSVSHPTAFDPDQPALPEGAVIETAELLEGPLNPAAERLLAGPGPVQEFLSPERWQSA